MGGNDVIQSKLIADAMLEVYGVVKL